MSDPTLEELRKTKIDDSSYYIEKTDDKLRNTINRDMVSLENQGGTAVMMLTHILAYLVKAESFEEQKQRINDLLFVMNHR